MITFQNVHKKADLRGMRHLPAKAGLSRAIEKRTRRSAIGIISEYLEDDSQVVAEIRRERAYYAATEAHAKIENAYQEALNAAYLARRAAIDALPPDVREIVEGMDYQYYWD